MHSFDNIYALVTHLRETLIPDLRQSGSDATADDFEDCLEVISSFREDRWRKDRKREYHFFTSSAAYWQTHASLRECQRLQEERDMNARTMQPQGYCIYKVYLPPEAHYKIRNFVPDLDDDLVEYIDTVRYTQSEATPAKKRRGFHFTLKIATGDEATKREAV